MLAWEKCGAGRLAEAEWKEKSAGGRTAAGGGPAILAGTRDQFRERQARLAQAQERPAQLILGQATGWLICLRGANRWEEFRWQKRDNSEIHSSDLMTRERKQSAKNRRCFGTFGFLFKNGLNGKLNLCLFTLCVSRSFSVSYLRVLFRSNLHNVQTSKILSQTCWKKTCFPEERRAKVLGSLLRNPNSLYPELLL